MTTGTDTGTTNSQPGLRSISEVEPERVEWLWQGRIALGKLNGLVGDPGVGKSVLSLEIAAAVSTGRTLPGGLEDREAANVLIISAEDAPSDTIRPRLEAAGANLDRVFLPDPAVLSDWSLPSGGVDPLEGWITDFGVRLVIIDPLSAFLDGKVDANSNSSIRYALRPLTEVADRTGSAILLIEHPNKSVTKQAIYRVSGSIGIVAALRQVQVLGTRPQDPDVKVLATLKSNLSVRAPSLVGRLHPVNDTVRFSFDGVSSLTADDLMAPPASGRSKQNEAEEWLRTQLSQGPVPSSVLADRAKEMGFSETTFNRARNKLGVVAKKEGFSSGSHWEQSLPDSS